MSALLDRGYARSFFRLVEMDPPTRAQFLSYVELLVTPPGASARELHLGKGVSMFETEEQARQAAATMKKRYDFIAEVRVPEGVLAERQGRRAGHHNVYASPDDLLRWVVRVVPVGLASPREDREDVGYEIWDRYERALVSDFDTEDEALDYLRERIRPLTAEASARWLDRLQLVHVFDDGNSTEVISAGVELLTRIFELTPAH